MQCSYGYSESSTKELSKTGHMISIKDSHAFLAENGMADDCVEFADNGCTLTEIGSSHFQLRGSEVRVAIVRIHSRH